MLMRLFAVLFAVAVAACTSVPFLQRTESAIVDGVKRLCGDSIEKRTAALAYANASLKGVAEFTLRCEGDPR